MQLQDRPGSMILELLNRFFFKREWADFSGAADCILLQGRANEQEIIEPSAHRGPSRMLNSGNMHGHVSQISPIAMLDAVGRALYWK